MEDTTKYILLGIAVLLVVVVFLRRSKRKKAE
jgi:LPXTG-motif cell wall-anchored protein